MASLETMALILLLAAVAILSWSTGAKMGEAHVRAQMHCVEK